LEEGRSRGALRLVGLERGGVKVLDVKTEERGDKLYVTIRAEIDVVERSTRLPSTARETAKGIFAFT
jgi:hypothetical protein